MKGKPANLRRLRTEQPNPAAQDLDRKSALEIVRLINAEDATVAGAVRRVLPQIAQAVDMIANSLRSGGRLIYVGAGTSGRLGALDASEIPPTFGVARHSVQFIIAGGPKALAAETEASEDSAELGRDEMARRKPGKNDVVIAIAASGRTPFAIGALQYARSRGAKTVALTCNRNSPLERAATLGIVTEVGPEVLAGSSRMKAGTAHKMVLNMLSTAAMARLGFVYQNLMVRVDPKNEKLKQRAIAILEQATGKDKKSASDAKGDAAQAKNDAGTAKTLASGARTEADALTGEIKSAKEQAADAVSRLADAEQRLADSTQREAAAEAKLSAIKTPRSLSNEAAFIAALTPFKGTEYLLNTFAEDESMKFTQALAKALDAAGWARKQPKVMTLGIPTMNMPFGQGKEIVPSCLETGIGVHVRAKESLAELQATPVPNLPRNVQAAVALSDSIAASISPADEHNVAPGILLDPESGEGLPITICVGKKP